MPTITDWLMVTITLIYVIATIIMCYSNWQSTQLTKESLIEARNEFSRNMKVERNRVLREQAICIACWYTNEESNSLVFGRNDCVPATIHIVNGSRQPIYDVVVSYDFVDNEKGGTMLTGDDNCVYLQSIPPGDFLVIVPWGGPGMHMHFEPSISFRDSRGIYWHRNACGLLSHINKTSIEYRKLSLPVEPGNYAKCSS